MQEFIDHFTPRSAIRRIVTAVLDDDIWCASGVCWSGGSTHHYNEVARHIEEQDDDVKRLIEDLVVTLRTRYRSATEYAGHLRQVPVTKESEELVLEKLDEECCICYTPLRGLEPVKRLRSENPGEGMCGHFLHRACLDRIAPDAQGTVHCPVCRASVGKRPGVLFYNDVENAIPQF
jgi:Ring finger domain